MNWGVKSMVGYVFILFLAFIVSMIYLNKVLNDSQLKDILYMDRIVIIYNN